jgi:poly(3-hydroxybutyrate) depolymerase
LGGATSNGGSKALGGTTSSGGSKALGGASSVGGKSSTGGATATGGATTTGGDAVRSSGCGKTPTLKNSPSTANQNTLTVGGKSRQFIMRWPDNYDNNHPYRLILGLHGATGKDTDIGPSYFGLFALANNSTIFLAPSADGGLWNATNDTAFVDEILKAVEADLCIDTSRVMLEGFSQGAAMSWTLACSRPGVFRAAVGHSGGGVANPTTCQPIPYLGSLGLSEGNGQNTQTDQFAKWNGCTITTLPRAPTGSHVCTDYTGCPASDPVRWCSYDGGHTPSPNDSGQSSSWMPKEVWSFLSKF